jgi:hypothetical protein
VAYAVFLPNFFPHFWRAFFEKAPRFCQAFSQKAYIMFRNGNDFVPALDMFNGFSKGIGK